MKKPSGFDEKCLGPGPAMSWPLTGFSVADSVFRFCKLTGPFRTEKHTLYFRWFCSVNNKKALNGEMYIVVLFEWFEKTFRCVYSYDCIREWRTLLGSQASLLSNELYV